MERYTQRREETWALAEGAELSRALDRLGRCEDLLSDLEREQTDLAHKLEELRLQGKNKSFQFKELMAESWSTSSSGCGWSSTGSPDLISGGAAGMEESPC